MAFERIQLEKGIRLAGKDRWEVQVTIRLPGVRLRP